jgi:Fe-S oxidoreductase
MKPKKTDHVRKRGASEAAPEVTREMVRRIMDRPPVWIERAYMPAYKSGRFPLEALAGAVVAACGMSPYDDQAVADAVRHLERLGYGDIVAAAWA